MTVIEEGLAAFRRVMEEYGGPDEMLKRIARDHGGINNVLEYLAQGFEAEPFGRSRAGFTHAECAAACRSKEMLSAIGALLGLM